ncbi:class I SAM-dependent methyltransferase [Chamaesiphon sp. OTE_8_metabat_110]|uniref:class I SAM-dependent methyltransferase n=1 Tax=Chamaesiphon sp. OTE_8_metabat_110 TaxID=2964696 RepID=UPI00286B6C89|nr:class I SAM-dependent methyltransferase [Chamaesiphon sp. OTE_8_metabat_110]
MTKPDPAIFFNREMAATYDQRNTVFAPLREALNFLIHAILAELPSDARILCVGVGTGVELIDLAQAFPQWQFTGIEPAAPMLDICRQRIAENGLTSRCTLHEGYLDSLPPVDSFDAATCLFVSHFLMLSEDRRHFFEQIAVRLRPQGYLINADLAADLAASEYADMLNVWLRVMQGGGDVSAEQIAKVRAAHSRDVAVLPPSAVAAIIAAGGFEPPVQFYQNLLMHAWYARRQ